MTAGARLCRAWGMQAARAFLCLAIGLALAAGLIGGAASPGYGHDLGLAKILVAEQAGRTFEVSVKAGRLVTLGPFPPPKSCTVSGLRHRYPSKEDQILSFDLDCGAGMMSGESKLLFPWRLQGAQITVRKADLSERTWFQRADALGVAFSLETLGGTEADPLETAADYVVLGVEHILFGIDHLALVLCLFLLARGRQLVLLITGFTIGHSVTLTLTALGHLSLPSAPVEASIALSIILLARQVMLRERRGHGTLVLTILFGMLHGFGFAGALNEIGLPEAQVLPALLSFNIGVELGQMLFIVSLAALAFTSAAIGIWRFPYGKLAGAVVGVFAALLFVERSAAIVS